MPEPKASTWNVWWTLTILAMVFTAIVLVLEGLGIIRDLGLLLTGLGLLASLGFGLSAATRTSVNAMRGEMRSVRSDLATLSAVLHRIEQILTERLPPPSRSP